MSPHSSGETPEAMQTAISEIAQNMDNLALGKPLQNVLRNASRTSGYNAS